MNRLIEHYYEIIKEYGKVHTSVPMFIIFTTHNNSIYINWHVTVPCRLEKVRHILDKHPFEFCETSSLDYHPVANTMFSLSIPFSSSIAQQYATKECGFALLKGSPLMYEYLWSSKTITNHF